MKTRSKLRGLVRVQVVDTKVVLNRQSGRAGSSASKVAECLVGDETGVIVFAARNEQGISLGLLYGPKAIRGSSPVLVLMQWNW